MNIDKDQIVQLLKSQGEHGHAEKAKGELPDKVDTDNGDHQNLLSKFGLDPADLVSKLAGGGLGGGLGKLL